MADGHSVEGEVVRYGRALLDGADASSFEQLPPSYGRDASHVFWGVNTIDLPLDLSAFRVLGPNHATDGRFILCGNIAIEEADRDSFRVLSERIAVDGQRVYFDGTPIAGADAATFEVLSDEYSRDRRHVFSYGEPLSGPIAASFEIISDEWTRDARHVFHRNEVVKGADPASFRRLGENHALDSRRAYHLSFPLEKADLSSTELLGPDGLRDRKRVFHRASLTEPTATPSKCSATSSRKTGGASTTGSRRFPLSRPRPSQSFTSGATPASRPSALARASTHRAPCSRCRSGSSSPTEHGRAGIPERVAMN